MEQLVREKPLSALAEEGIPQIKENKERSTRHTMPQLDSLRAIAVLLVVIHHYATAGNPIHDLRLGGLGVRPSFVLSGFLITGILLSCRILSEEKGIAVGHLLRVFYIRRSLRIFPVYYVLLGGLLLIGLGNTPYRATIPWLLTYTINIYSVDPAHNIPFYLAHLWSLAVEEQFYLLWPFVVLGLPKRLLGVACWVLIAIGIGSRSYAVLTMPQFGNWADFTPTVLDAIGLGSLLALACNRYTSGLEARLPGVVSRATLEKVGLYIGLPLAIAMTFCRMADFAMRAVFVLRLLGIALVCVWIISRAAVGFQGWPGRVLEWPALRYLGKISYGIFLFHLIVPILLGPILLKESFLGVMQRMAIPPGAQILSLAMPLSIGLAALSWHLFEKPLNDLKKHFPYEEKVAG